MAELNNFLYLMTSSSMDEQLKKLYQNWERSQPMPSDSLIHWGDLIAYRKNFHKLIPESHQLNSSLHLLEIKRSLLNVAFAQKNCEAAKFILKDLKFDIQECPTAEKVFKFNLAIGKNNLMIVQQKLMQPNQKIQKLCSGLKKLIGGILKHENIKEFPSILVEAFSYSSEITWKILEIYLNCRAEGLEVSYEHQKIIVELLEVIEEDDFDITEHLKRYSESSIKNAKKWAQKDLDASFSHEKETQLAKAFYKLGLFYYKVYKTGTITVS